MRFSQSKLDKQADRQEASNYRGLSKLGRKQHLATRPVSRRRPMEIKLPFLRAYRLFSPTEPALPKRVEDPRSAPRETFNVKPVPTNAKRSGTSMRKRP